MRAAGLEQVRESHGYLIQHLIDNDRTITELARRMEVTQQAASKAVAELTALGVLEVLPGLDRREKTVRLSDRGWTLIRMGRRIRRGIERRLIRLAGGYFLQVEAPFPVLRTYLCGKLAAGGPE
jgi:DNA-binding MarR family transcriptional regulator